VFIVIMLTGEDDDGTTGDTPTPADTTSMKVIDEGFLLG
jgi:hypothetical protein